MDLTLPVFFAFCVVADCTRVISDGSGFGPEEVVTRTELPATTAEACSVLTTYSMCKSDPKCSWDVYDTTCKACGSLTTKFDCDATPVCSWDATGGICKKPCQFSHHCPDERPYCVEGFCKCTTDESCGDGKVCVNSECKDECSAITVEENCPADRCTWDSDSRACMMAVITCGGTGDGALCKFPFTYRGESYDECISTDHHQHWCYTESYGTKWGNCNCQATIDNSPTWRGNGKPNLLLCQGACEIDDDCSDGLQCFQRDKGGLAVPGCEGFPISDWGYCYKACSSFTNSQSCPDRCTWEDGWLFNIFGGGCKDKAETTGAPSTTPTEAATTTVEATTTDAPSTITEAATTTAEASTTAELPITTTEVAITTAEAPPTDAPSTTTEAATTTAEAPPTDVASTTEDAITTAEAPGTDAITTAEAATTTAEAPTTTEPPTTATDAPTTTLEDAEAPMA